MRVSFTKLNGAGNDFIAIDNRKETLTFTKETIANLCHRHFGIGADGLLLLENSDPADAADYKMRYFNADGSEAEMCGNGARCFAQFVRHLPRRYPHSVSFLTLAGNITATYADQDAIALSLTPPQNLILNQAIVTKHGTLYGHSLNTGVPHFVTFVDDLDNIDVAQLGSLIRHHEAFRPSGTNVNFATILSPGHIAIRTYERGVEAETLACGTGVTAAALIYHILESVASPIQVDVAGKATLQVSFEKEANHVFSYVTLQGPAKIVFEGVIDI